VTCSIHYSPASADVLNLEAAPPSSMIYREEGGAGTPPVGGEGEGEGLTRRMRGIATPCRVTPVAGLLSREDAKEAQRPIARIPINDIYSEDCSAEWRAVLSGREA